MFSKRFDTLAHQLGQLLIAADCRIAVAESCTGGALSQVLTAVSGASAYFDRGFITYSNEAKHELLGVPWEILSSYGAVSAQTALAMAQGVLAHSYADIAVSITGIAGPTGASMAKPIGLVYFGFVARMPAANHIQEMYFSGDRDTIRALSVEWALRWLIMHPGIVSAKNVE